MEQTLHILKRNYVLMTWVMTVLCLKVNHLLQLMHVCQLADSKGAANKNQSNMRGKDILTVHNA